MDPNALAEAKAFLQQTGSANGDVSVYDQLTDAITTSLNVRTERTVDLLEASLSAKATRFVGESVTFKGGRAPGAARAAALEDLYRDPVVPVEGEEEAAEEVPEPNQPEYVQDVFKLRDMCAQIGVDISTSEFVNLAAVMKKISEDPALGVTSLTYFGKFLGTQAAYHVFEAKLAETLEEIKSPEDALHPTEEDGTGANTFTYFVCNDLGGPVTRLAPVTPGQITASARITKYLTGDLRANVSSWPVFPGQEAEYLRAIIARLSAEGCAAPSGALSEADGVIEKSEDFAAEEDPTAITWTHSYLPILQVQGRCVKYVNEEVAEGEDEPVPSPGEDEEEVPPLGAIEDDEGFKPIINAEGEEVPQPCWKTGVSGKYQSKVAFTKSLRWPGALAVCKGVDFANLYVGFGVKFHGKAYVPPGPPTILNEFTPTEEGAELAEQADDIAVKAPEPEPVEEEAEE